MSIQNKILVGIGSFVGIMLLLMWVIINEPARMDAFTQQFQGRSIEKGAELFLNNCASCHGIDGKGLAGVGPALNNPMLFLDEHPGQVAQGELDALEEQRTNLQAQLEQYNTLLTQRDELAAQVDAAEEGSENRATLEQQLEDVETQINNFDPNTEARIAELDTQIASAQANLDAVVAAGWDPSRPTRLAEMQWTGTLEDYIESTLVSGRPLSIFYWPRAMPYWAQSSGGPMRDDQIDSLVLYLMNYEREALELTPNDINQQFKVPANPDLVASAGPREVLGTDVDVMALDLSGGDVAAGELKYNQLGCAGCHAVNGGAAYSFAPTAGTYTRTVNVRLNDPANEDLTAEQYLAESITHPNEYIVPGGSAGLMPQNYGDQLTLEELQDLVAYLAAQQ
jgi:mono/diheme cytochrome c family protein